MKITNHDMNASIALGQGQAQNLFVFSLKELAGATLDLNARQALTALARKLQKLWVKEQEDRDDMVTLYGKADEKGNYRVVRADVMAEPEGAKKWEDWKKANQDWMDHEILASESDPIAVPIYQEDVEALNPEFMSALSDIVVLSIREGKRPESVREENEKLKKRITELEGQIKTILEAASKKRE